MLFFVYQVFESIESVSQFESELRADGEEVQHSCQLKDISSGIADATQPSWVSLGLSQQCSGSDNSLPVAEQSAETLEVLEDKTEAESQPAVEDATYQGVVKEEISKLETGSENEVRKDCAIGEPGDESSVSEAKPQGEGKTTNLISAPEKTNVLKLETEIHNEYYQAPPLGQTLAFQASKNKPETTTEPCASTAEKEMGLPSEIKRAIFEKSEADKYRSQMSKACATESESKDAATAFSDLAESKKVVEIPSEKPGSNSPVRQVLNALQSLSSHSRQSPDTADSDDSPSALEMEDIPAGITCVTSGDLNARPLAGLAAPPMCFAQREKMESVDLVLDHHLDTSPEGTDLGLSEEEPEIENVLTEPGSAGMGGDAKHESSEEQTYSVSIIQDMQQHISFNSYANIIFFAARDTGHVLD